MIQYILTEHAKSLIAKGIDVTPKRGTEHAAGMDLCACIDEPITLLPGEMRKIFTGVKVFLGTTKYLVGKEYDLTTLNAVPVDKLVSEVKLSGLYLPRSSSPGLKLENTVGLLDCDFQGESFVKLRNMSQEPVKIIPGERLVQLVIVPVVMDKWEQVTFFDETVSRNPLGDGSTGKL
jgi:dUTP pyrophosphatase